MRKHRVRDDKRSISGVLVLCAALSVTLFLGTLAFTLLGSTTSGRDTTVVDRVAAIQEQPSEAELAAAAAGVVETFEVFGAKNPFERPLAFELQPTTTTVDDTGDDGTDDGTTDDGTETTTPTTELDPGRARRVELREIYALDAETVANIVVDSVLYEALAAGDQFASTFQVISLDPATGCGLFLNGDVDFELCVGQEILK